MSNGKTKAPPLDLKTTDHYHARPSTSEPGQWTIMEQVAGETRLRLFARARDVQAAARMLNGLQALGLGIDQIVPVASFQAPVEVEGGETMAQTFDVYADGSVFVDGARLPIKSGLYDSVIVPNSGPSPESLRAMSNRLKTALRALPGGEA